MVFTFASTKMIIVHYHGLEYRILGLTEQIIFPAGLPTLLGVNLSFQALPTIRPLAPTPAGVLRSIILGTVVPNDEVLILKALDKTVKVVSLR